jgi:hypothetical protein
MTSTSIELISQVAIIIAETVAENHEDIDLFVHALYSI